MAIYVCYLKDIMEWLVVTAAVFSFFLSLTHPNWTGFSFGQIDFVLHLNVFLFLCIHFSGLVNEVDI